MAEKKDRSRFSIKFNEQDPMHDKVIRLLEQQPSHGKAQFIVNAILHYMNCSETSDVTLLPMIGSTTEVDRTTIEEIVKEILMQQGIFQNEESEQTKEPLKQEKDITTELSLNSDELINTIEHQRMEKPMNEAMRAMIANTMSAFRNK